MANGASTIGEFPFEMIRISCVKCERAGQYRRTTLLKHYGANMVLPELRHVLAQCPLRHTMNDPCMVIFPDLVGR